MKAVREVFQWLDIAVTDLINIWGDVSDQTILKGTFRNHSMFQIYFKIYISKCALSKKSLKCKETYV